MGKFKYNEWHKSKYTQKCIIFDNEKDKDLLEKLEKIKLENKSISTYIKNKMRG